MKMKLFYATNAKEIRELEANVNAFLAGIAATAKIFAVNTASSTWEMSATPANPTVVITVWYGA
jgi:hypothetical protein